MIDNAGARFLLVSRVTRPSALLLQLVLLLLLLRRLLLPLLFFQN